MLTMLRPRLSPIKHAIMERMCKVSDDLGMVRMTANEILKPLKKFQDDIKYRYWVELVRDQRLIHNILSTDKTINKFFRDVGSVVHYQVTFPSIAPIPKNRANIMRLKLSHAHRIFEGIHKIATSDPALTHKSAEELLAECAFQAKRGFMESQYQKDEILKYLEILGNGGEISWQVAGDQEDAGGREGDDPGIREGVEESSGPQA